MLKNGEKKTVLLWHVYVFGIWEGVFGIFGCLFGIWYGVLGICKFVIQDDVYGIWNYVLGIKDNIFGIWDGI